ncbi:MAG: hypothetical protein EXS48_01035 [Candidatus Staskawiczbacteria bacterium]|nr:hypothetical protein [Candidatus Staskawiczbacteria bacterium]
MKINGNATGSNLEWAYKIAMFSILTLPFLVLPPWFFPVDFGKTIVFRLIASVLMLLFTWQFFYRNETLDFASIKKDPSILTLLIFLALTIISTIFSQDVVFSLWGSPYRSGGTINLVLYGLLALFCFLVFKKSSDWKVFLDYSIGVGIAVCLVAFIQFYSLLSTIFIPIPGRPPSTMGNPIVLGLYLLLLFFIALSLAIKERVRTKKIYYLVALVAFLYTILISGSRAAYLGILVGGIYFGWFYFKKYKGRFLKVKAGIGLLAVVGIMMIALATTNTKLPQVIGENKLFEAIYQRLSLKEFFNDPRFSAWRVIVQQIKEKPLLGWGPENLAIGFDKHYDPSLPFISKEWGGWWDKAHNGILETAAVSGVPAALTFLALLALLFWRLQQKKSLETDSNKEFLHGLQALLIGYAAASLFTFDTFSTYLLFFLTTGYILYLTSPSASAPTPQKNKPSVAGIVVLPILTVALAILVWQYHLLPLSINKDINRFDNLVNQHKCDEALTLAETTLQRHSFLDPHLRIHYLEAIKDCGAFFPEKSVAYATKALELTEVAVRQRPTYSRFWIFGAGFANVVAQAEQEPTHKNELLNLSRQYLATARELAPRHQEIYIEMAKNSMLSGDYKAMRENGLQCIALDESLSDCYWIKGTAEIYLKNPNQAKKVLQVAIQKNLGTPATSFLHLLVNAYIATKDHANLAEIYKQLVEIHPKTPAYHSSLAFTYYQLGDYENARKETLIFMELMPEAREEAEAFLRLLPK